MPDTLIGLDLGKVGDPTALAVLRRHLIQGSDNLPVRGSMSRAIYGYTCGMLKRWKDISYPDVVKEVTRTILDLNVGKPRLVIDGTGVGSAVVDMFLHAGVPADVIPITITGGSTWRTDRWPGGRCRAYWVAKTEIVSHLQAALQQRRLWVKPDQPDAPVLKKELAEFRVKVTKAANETYEAREGEHDDLVLAVAMPVWVGASPYTHFRTEPVNGSDATPEVAAMRAEAEKEKQMREAVAAEAQKRAEEAYMNPMADHWYSR